MRYASFIFRALAASMPASLTYAAYNTTLTNFNAAGAQTTRFNTAGDAVDAHDGKISLFNGEYYLYGTSYDCGYEWQVTGASFCGFKAYSSPDLVHWTDRGYLFNAATATWQTRCSGTSYGCYRPHVIYNPSTSLYVLWINVYDNIIGFRVFASPNPAGPFIEAPVPVLAVNAGAPIAGLNNGDHDLFVDDDGTAYIAFTDWRTGGRIAIERLNSTFLSGTGSFVQGITPGSTEAPALFKRSPSYYLTYSDPNCGYCGGTGTSYRTATSPLGPWSATQTNINANSCGGQPSFVAAIPVTSGTAYLYGSDLWNNAAKNEALANYFWAPLTFAANGSINAISCQNTVTMSLSTGSAGSQLPPAADLDNTAGVDGFRTFCDIGSAIRRSQSFVATRTGVLNAVSFTTFQNGKPNAGLEIAVYAANASYQPIGAALSSVVVPTGSMGWSARGVTANPNIPVTAGSRYAIVVRSAASAGCYGMEYNDSAPYPGGGAAYSNNSGASFAAETNRTLKFETHVSPATGLAMRRQSRRSSNPKSLRFIKADGRRIRFTKQGK